MVTKMAENSAKVEFQNVSFWYSTKQILFDISLKIVPNKITALIGPSGCGKSTLLRAINRMNDLIQIARIEGKVLYDNKPVYAKEVDVVNLRRSIGMVFQKSNPFPLSIFDNVAYGLRLQHIKDKKKIEAVVMESLQKADLWEEVKDRLQLSAFRLSGGQQQRLCIARALAIQMSCCLMSPAQPWTPWRQQRLSTCSESSRKRRPWSLSPITCTRPKGFRTLRSSC